MILVDTSVWIDHLRAADEKLVQLLHDRQIASHPFVVGEIALGSLRHREQVLAALNGLPSTPIMKDHEVLLFIDRQNLAGQGIGYVDAHLLMSVLAIPGYSLWTRDKRLGMVARKLGLDGSLVSQAARG